MGWPKALLEGIVEEEHFGRTIKVYSQRPKNLTELLWKNVSLYPDKEALVCENIRLSYGQFQDKIDRMAYQLYNQWGVRKGDRVGVLFGNNIEFCISIFAICQLGAIAVTLNTRLQAPELEFMLNDSGSKLLIMDKDYYPNIENIRNNLTSLEQIFIHGQKPFPPETLPFEELIKYAAPKRIVEKVDEDDIAFIVYTSGTTGRPKGAMEAHINIIHSCVNYQRVMGITPEDKTLIAVPLFHITGMVAQLILFLYAGGTAVIMKEYKTDRFIELLSLEKVTHTIVVPTIYVLMLMNEKLGQYDLSSWRIAAYGGAPISEITITQLAERFPRLKLFNCYGATETASPATILPSEESLRKSASVGLPVPVGEIKICDEEGHDLEVDKIGEIWIKGPMVVPGYWNNPEANAKEFTDGFWHSGDLGKIDSEGFVYVLDRKKDMINRGGEKIFCVEVENVLCSHPKVMEAAVVGVPCNIFGEQVKAVIVPKPGVIITTEEIQNYVKTKLAHYKVPKYVVFVPALPRNPGGKVLKKELIGIE